ncbi:hypothetical protein CSC17_1848 [Klebsiella oxytoca]|nr:hypothetical protein CSC17_1848 [Klebsiella oxytoca]
MVCGHPQILSDSNFMIFLTFITHYTFSDQSKANNPPTKLIIF